MLDCTLRDGGYINDWKFGYNAIKGIIRKLERTGIEMIEVGFIKGEQYDIDSTLFPLIEDFKNVIENKVPGVMYVGMIDMNNPVPIEKISPYDGLSIDAIRVIFKKNRITEALDYCQKIIELGYKCFVNLVNSDLYSDVEFVETISLFNEINPTALSIVDTFGVIKKKQFCRLVSLADNNLKEGIMLCYHAHNNLQQALLNAEAMVEMNLQRDIVIDACVFGMGRGAGNLNLEVIADYLNENCDTSYCIDPILEIMDEYLVSFYRKKFWGYSMPLYLSALLNCHPNYAIYYAEKNCLTEKSFSGLLSSIATQDKSIFSKERADYYYKQYFCSEIDDSDDINELKRLLAGKQILLLCPGKNLNTYDKEIRKFIDENTIVISVNFYDRKWNPKYVISTNSRRFAKLFDMGVNDRIIATSNVYGYRNAKYVIDFNNFSGNHDDIDNNGGIIAIRFLHFLGVKNLMIAGMDGYSNENAGNYYIDGFESERNSIFNNRNNQVQGELDQLKKMVNIVFVTPSIYSC